MAVLHLDRWNIAIGEGHPLVCIAGLNVLEDLDLALDTGRELKAVTAELGMPFVFKASFDKANRSSIRSYRGPGMAEGLKMLAAVKAELNVPIATDLHELNQVEPVAAVADLVQIPAFLCRQTDLVVAAARATKAAGGLLHVKKGQFLAPWDCRNILDKIKEAVEIDMDESLGVRMLKCGGHGVFYQKDSPDAFVKGVQSILAGDIWVSRKTFSRFFNQARKRDFAVAPVITRREKEILDWVASGASNDKIGDVLAISPHTVRTHLSNIYTKLNLTNRFDAALWATQNL